MAQQPGPSKRPRHQSPNTTLAQYDSSGLKRSFHGVVYQFKLLMLFVQRAMKNGYKFNLATEMDAADKFDDVVLVYEENKRNIHRFLQAKHKQEECKQETKMINNKKTKIETQVKLTTKELLEGPLDGDFYLPKYFMSYRKIMKNKQFNSDDNKVRDVILCTNIDLDCEELKDRGIKTEEIVQVDSILNVLKKNKQPKRYKLSVPDKKNEFYEKLRQTSDLNRLAHELLACFDKNKTATLGNKLFEQYHVALMEKVLQLSTTKTECKFRNSFFAKKIKDQDVLKFREAMKICSGITDDTAFKNEMKDKLLKVSSTFVTNKIRKSNTQQLGDDKVDDKEIEDFLDKFVLAVDQPNEIELGQIINDEIGSEFNLIHPDFVTSSFQAEVLDWLKTKDGLYLSSEEAEKFFQSLRAKLFKLVLIGPSAIFSSKLSSYGVSYEDGNATLKKIEDFLKSDNQVLSIKTTQPRLGSLKVNQILTQNADFQKNDSFVFISSKFLLSMEQQLLAAFKAEHSKPLLAIECAETLRLEHFKLINETLSNPLMKLIVIARESAKTKLNSNKSFDEVVDDSNSFQFLTLESQNKVLKTNVIFQGLEMKLDGIVGATPEIDEDTLLQLLNDLTLTIGRDVKHHDFDPNYYIPRFYCQHVEINTGIEDEFIKRGFSDVICYDEATFDNLDGSGNAHLLQNRYGRTLVWKKSKGKITRLVSYKKKNENNKYSSTMYARNDTNLLEGQVVIIADSAGMGKSNSLSSLALQLKKLDPSFWVVRVNLNDYTTAFQNRFDSFEDITNFLTENVLNLHGFGAELFKARLVEKDKIVFLFDGFDEISPNYKDVVLQMTETLLTYSTKMFVTSRLSTSDAVEEKLGVFSHRIRPFSKDEQNTYLCNYWSGTVPSERCQTYVNSIIEKLSESISDRECEFTGIPLQMRMVRDIFRRSEPGKWQGYADFVTSNGAEPQLPSKLDVMFLYEKFFWEKFTVISMEKKRDDLTKVGVREDNETLFKNLIVEHQSAALYSMLDEEAVKKLLPRKDIMKMKKFLREVEEEKKNRGIIDLIVDNKPRFVHRTFMEYLIADFFFTALLFDCSYAIVEFVFCHILLRKEYGVIRTFMDNMFLKLLNNFNADFSNVFTLKSDYESNIGDVFEESRAEVRPKIAKMWENQRESCIGDRNTTVFHVMVEEENFNLLKFIIECMNNDTIKTMADVRRDIDDGTLLYMLASKQNVELIEYVLTKPVHVDSVGRTGETVLTQAIRECFQPSVIETLIKFGAKVNNAGDDGRYDIHNAAENGNVDVIKAMLKANCSVNVADDCKITVLHYAVYSGNADVVELIGSEVDRVDARDENGYTALHYAAYAGNWEMCQWLAQRIDVEVRADDGSGILHEAAISGNCDLFKFFVEDMKFDVGIVDEAGRTPLHEAAKYDNIEIVKYIIEEKCFSCFGIIDENGHTPIHEAAKYGSEELLIYLFGKGMQIDSTLLHIAALYGNLEAVKWLTIQNGIDVHSKDDDGCTVLQNACKEGEETKKWGLKRNATVRNTVCPDGIERTRGWSSFPDDLIISVLVNDCGVDINEATADGGTVLHNAVTSRSLHIVEDLIKNGADSSLKDAHGTSAFELAWDNAFVQILQAMVNCKNITSKNRDGRGLLHWAVETDDVDFLRKLLLVDNVDLSILDGNGKTALDLANDLGRLECQDILKLKIYWSGEQNSDESGEQSNE